MDGICDVLQSPILFLSPLKLNTALKVSLMDYPVLSDDGRQGTCGSVSYPISKDH